VITFPQELFYPVGVLTVGVFIKKGVPQKEQRVLWIRATHDGFRLKKGRRLPHPDEPNDLKTIAKLLKSFLKNPSLTVENKPQFQKATKIDSTDKALELCPEVYLDELPISSDEVKREAERLVRESIAYLIRSGKEDKLVAKN